MFTTHRAGTIPLIVLFLAAGGSAAAEHLPIRVFTTADGLPANAVNCIVQDSHQFLWLCSWNGLARFDGYTFTTYGVESGLPERLVTSMLQARDGTYWVATYGGVVQLRPDFSGDRRSLLQFPIRGSDRAQHATSLAQAPDGSIWCGTHDGLFRLAADGTFTEADIGLPSGNWKARFVQAIAFDASGALWAATNNSGFYRRRRSGAVDHFSGPSALVYALLVDHQNRLWAGTARGVCVLDSDAVNEHACTHVYGVADGLPSVRVKSLFEDREKTIWAGTEAGVAALRPGAAAWRAFRSEHGIADLDIHAFGEDAGGNLWIAAGSCLMRMARSGIVSYSTADGLAENHITSLFNDANGQMWAVSGIRHPALNRFDGARFQPLHPLLIKSGRPISYAGWGTGQTIHQDRRGDWWIPTGEGLCHWKAGRRAEELARIPPDHVYTMRDGLPGNDVFRVFEDRDGAIWVVTVDNPGLARQSSGTESFHAVDAREGFRSANPAASFTQDTGGNLWVGMFWEGLARYRHGEWKVFEKQEIPPGSLWSALTDRNGRVWMASSNSGVLRIDDPTADNPRLLRYTTANGLASDLVMSIAEDRSGRIYVANERGLDVIAPASGRVRHFDTNDGLASGDKVSSLRASDGAIWVGATSGLSRVTPVPEEATERPPIRITGLRVAGIEKPVSLSGEASVTGLELAPNQNHLDIGFASISFRAGAEIRYQYRLEGGRGSWSQPSEARSVTLAELAPGTYRFLVRALNDGKPSSEPASISFIVLAPLWRRWWAITAAAMCISALLYAAHRYRVAQLVAVERVRTRIAMDLHDDIGSSLSQISVLSEVARQNAESSRAPAEIPLARVAEIAREVIDSLGDLVWAIAPQRDTVRDLVQRMRRFGEDLLSAADIEFVCQSGRSVAGLELDAEVRRQVFLIFKEAIHNVARHSGCRRAWTEVDVRDRQLFVVVGDDGTGFDSEGKQNGSGHGVMSMRQRARNLGGQIEVCSTNRCGVTITLTVPLRGSHLFRWQRNQNNELE